PASCPAAARGPPRVGEGPVLGPNRRLTMQFQSTRIYQQSLELIDFVARVIKGLPPGFAFLVDQVRRAAASVTLNFVEGCGRTGAADRQRFFSIAIGSA